MRIALIATSLRLAGAEKQFTYAARTLFKAGIDVRVFNLGEREHYHSVLSDAGVSVQQIFLPNRPWTMLLRLTLELARFKPQIVLASQFGDLAFAIPAGRVCGALVLGGVRSDGFYELRTSGWRKGMFLRGAHGLIANSHRARTNLISRGTKAEKIAVVPNSIDLNEFDRRARLQFPSCTPAGRLQVTAVGGLQECKRFDRFLEALAQARRVEPALYGVIAGEDLGSGASLERSARDLNLSPRHVAFLGKCEYIPALLSQSRALVLCSDYEGFPNVILEAMAARLPVITTPAGDAARIVEHQTTGFVLQTEDVQGLADAMIKLARQPKLCVRMGEAGRWRSEERYDVASLPERLLSVFGQFARQQQKISLLKLLPPTAAAKAGVPEGSLSYSSVDCHSSVNGFSV
jgi:glycosyltransferase involved in cell wall biosynthesis